MKLKILIILLLISANILAQKRRAYGGYVQGEFIEVYNCNRYIVTDLEGKRVEVLMEDTLCDSSNPNHEKLMEYIRDNVIGSRADILVDLPMSSETTVQGIVLYGCWIDETKKMVFAMPKRK